MAPERKAVSPRLLLALLAAPLIGGIAAMALSWASVAALGEEDAAWLARRAGDIIPIGLTYGFAIGMPVTLTLGLAAHMLLQRFHRSGWPAYGALGAAGGYGVFVLMALGARLMNQDIVGGASLAAPDLFWSAYHRIGLYAGALTALIFWLIRQPDRLPANPLNPAE